MSDLESLSSIENLDVAFVSLLDSMGWSSLQSSDSISNNPTKSVHGSYEQNDVVDKNLKSDEVASNFDKRLLETCKKFKKETCNRVLESLKKFPPANNEETINRISKDVGLSPQQVRDVLMPRTGFVTKVNASLKTRSSRKSGKKGKALIDACRCAKHKKRRTRARKRRSAYRRKRRRRR